MKSQKQIKEEYKLKKFKMGVFQIRNTVNGKIYVGSSLNLDAIWNRNKMELNFGNHRNSILQSEWKQFGERNFMYEILAEVVQKDEDKIDYNKEVKTLEGMFIAELNPVYNSMDL
jgi:group I intron endonuclease